MIGVALAIVYIALETLSNSAIKVALFNAFPELRPGPKHITITNGLVTEVRLSDLNRSLAAELFVFWPCLLIIGHWLSGRMRLLALGGLCALTALAIYASDHASSMVAFPVSLLVFFWAKWSQRSVYWGHIAAWCMGILLVVPLALAAYHYGLHQKSWIAQDSGQARIIIWATTAKEVLKNPVLGIGVRSSRHVSAKLAATEKKPEGFAYPRVTGHHSHNSFLQTWFELGGFGAALLLALGVMMINWISRLDAAHQPYAYATFAAAVTISQFSWGIWQVWYMAAFVVSAFALALALRFSDGKSEPGL